MKKVLIPTKLDKVAAEYLSGKGYQVVQDSETDLMALCQANTDAEALIVRSEKITPEIIDLLPGLKAIVRAGAGFGKFIVDKFQLQAGRFVFQQHWLRLLTVPGCPGHIRCPE